MSLEDRYNFEELANEAERVVLDELERQLADCGVSDPDEDQILDMAAYALNQVPPRYRVNLLGRLYAQHVSDEYREQARAAVASAIHRVLTGPA